MKSWTLTSMHWFHFYPVLFQIILYFIMKYCGWVIVEEMLQQCNQGSQTPIHVACLWNNVETANLLLTDDLNKIVNKIYNSTKRTNATVALKEASRRALFWQIGRLETKNVLLYIRILLFNNNKTQTQQQQLYHYYITM